MRRGAIAASGVLLASLMLTLTGSATAQQDCSEATVCTEVAPRVDPEVSPQLGPVVEQVGPNEFSFGGLLDGIFG